jgi:hypothetical protein
VAVVEHAVDEQDVERRRRAGGQPVPVCAGEVEQVRRGEAAAADVVEPLHLRQRRRHVDHGAGALEQPACVGPEQVPDV